MSKEMFKIFMYIIMGGFTTLVNIIVYWIAAEPLEMDYRVSTTIAWIAAVLFAYVVNKKYVFESNTPTLQDKLKEMTAFFGFRFLSFFMDLFTMIILVSGLHIDGTLSKIAANVVVLIANYIFSKRFIFVDRQKTEKNEKLKEK
ncbi:GtrA family protein [Bacillus sp. B-jedd]|uniref:GtrA family protein n=1 Tax=Bacillus sp. B-jedd TaxID=1476857 RepID=UPI000515710A|nr:GtrA family protein [Bacillus sp. B-jedd]CEG29094.1 teichoic acid glycosylation protein [Bacillus sp. B-jedd]